MNKIVTAIFGELWDTKYGGRPKQWKLRYLNGILRFKNNNFKKIIYTSDTEAESIRVFLRRELTSTELELYTVKIYNFQSYYRHDQILELLQLEINKGIPPDRSIHIQWLKFEFLNKEAETGSYVYWVDAGLIDPILFPDSVYTQSFEMLNEKYLTGLNAKIGSSM